MRVSAWIVVIGSWLSLVEPLTAFDGVRLKTELTALFTEGWTLGVDGLAAATGHYQAARETAPSDVRVDYAWAVVQIRQRRYSDAAAALDTVLARKRDHWSAWQGKIWLEMVARKYDAALADVDRLAEKLPISTNEADRDEMEALSRFLGRFFGYLWGPSAGKIDEDQLKETEAKIIAKLSPTDRGTFDESRNTVLGKFTNLQDKAETTREIAKLDEDKQKEIDRERLAAEKNDVAKEKGTIDQQATAARASAEAQLRTLTAAKAQLDAQFNQMAARAGAIQAEINALLAQEQGLLALADQADTAAERRRLRDEALLISRPRIQAQAAYGALDAQAAGVNAQRNANLQQQQQVTSVYQAEMRRLGLRAETITRTDRRIAGDMKKAATASTGNTAGARAISSSSTSFVTYFDFPVDREKARILDSLR